MEVASPLPFTPAQAGTKRAFACSPGLVEAGSSQAVGMDLEDFAQPSFKRRRFNDTIDSTQQQHSFAPSPFATIGRSTPPLSNGTGRNRTDGTDLNVVVQHQAAEIESLKTDKAALQSSVHELRAENEKVVHENKILKKAVTIQQERQNQAGAEIEAARRYKDEAEDKMRKLEQMILTLRYHLQAKQSPTGNDFMGFHPRPPDVY